MVLARYLDPKNDLAFKKIFGTEKNKEILKGFLNDILEKEGKGRIEAISFLNPLKLPGTVDKKQCILDILCTDERGSQYIVEMQVAKGGGFEKRVQFYASAAYVQQLKEQEEYLNLKEVISLAIVNFTMFPDLDEYKTKHVISETKSSNRYLKDLSFHFLELPKFNKKIDQLVTNEDKWCYFLKNTHASEDVQKAIKVSSNVIKKAYNELLAYNWSDEELAAYEAVVKQNRDRAAREWQVKEDGRIEGKIEGRVEATGAIVRKMLQKQLPLEAIVELTGLTQEEIQKLTESSQEMANSGPQK